MSASTEPVLALATELIARASVTPDDAGCQALIAERLRAAGFSVETMRFGNVDNMWASRGTEGGPTLAFLGHTDVVPSGPEGSWSHPPFQPRVVDGWLCGRGAADMKGSVAAMVCALEDLSALPLHGRVGLLLTSDEEGDALDGVRRVAETFRARSERIDWCVVGEPSSAERLGDVVRIGRRGSLTANIHILGRQGHVAYPQLARNPIHLMLPALQALVQRQWDEQPWPEFPPTSLQIANVNAGTGASNVIPGGAEVQLNLRFSPRWTADALIDEIERMLATHGLQFEIRWHRSGDPFHTRPGPLRSAVAAALREAGLGEPDQNTGGGTSDGRFIAPLGAEVVELGPLNATIHQVDERVPVEQLLALRGIYVDIARRLLGAV